MFWFRTCGRCRLRCCLGKEKGGYQVIVPALPGIVTYGRDLEEAREMARDAIVCHLRGLLKDGEEIPEDPFTRSQPVTEELRVTV